MISWWKITLAWGLFVAGCGYPGNPRVPSTFLSSETQGHRHTVTFSVMDFAVPAPNGIIRETSPNEGHTHEMQLTHNDLELINLGADLLRNTTTVRDHFHTVELKVPDVEPEVGRP